MRLLITSISFFFLSSFSMSFSQDICLGADVEISAEGMSYSPAELIVDVGTTVGWVNYEGFHDVNGVTSSITLMSFNNPEDFSLPAMTGTSEGVCLGTHTFTSTGVYLYDCTTYGHASGGMVANITVMAVVPGCTDSSACNYDQTATEDDESCLFVGDACDDGSADTELDVIQEDCSCEGSVAPVFGCIDLDACNYDQTATEDDESCLFIGDVCDDGSADTESDVIQDDCSCEGSIISSIDNFEALSVLMFPNPATSELNITLNKKSTLKVFDAIGKMVQETGSVLTWALDVSDWEKGLYTLQTQAGKTYKFIVE
ncbi:MAG: T9SS type A sorting domain-containing protein [Flavobacteriales bacterium]